MFMDPFLMAPALSYFPGSRILAFRGCVYKKTFWWRFCCAPSAAHLFDHFRCRLLIYLIALLVLLCVSHLFLSHFCKQIVLNSNTFSIVF